MKTLSIQFTDAQHAAMELRRREMGAKSLAAVNRNLVIVGLGVVNDPEPEPDVAAVGWQRQRTAAKTAKPNPKRRQ
jgi:hypothetical protein